MPPPKNKENTPFKTMDIKAALLSSANRKRKTPPSPQLSKSDPKALKLSTESTESGDDDVKMLDEACGITVKVNTNELESNNGDCKENKDINAANVESPKLDCNENKSLSKKDEISPPVNKTCNGTVSTSAASPVSALDNSDNDTDQLSKKQKLSENSSDELNLLSVSLNTSGLSITGEDDEKGNTSNSNKTVSNTNTEEKDVKKSETKEKVKKKKMTPAEAQKRAEERELKQKERLLKKEELESKKRQRLLEKEQKIREKNMRKEREELERKERELLKQEKKEQEEKERLQRQKEREEKLKIKQMMLELKMKEKKRREEMRLKREEEMKKAEEEKLKAKLEKEVKERERKERAKAAFAKFFLKGDNNTSAPPPPVTEKEGAFLPFQVSDDMILAPVIPAAAQERFNKLKLDHFLECQDGKELYLQILKSESYSDVRQRKKTRKPQTSDDVLVIDKNAQTELGLCPKLLQFCENVRPPYWGTWRKKSKNIRPKNPFGQDDLFDYSVDSDDEWDEGGPGESLSGTEQEDESEDDYEVDNEFFVPHGYLSDEEEKKEDDDEEVNDPEKQKAILKLKLHEFEMERKKKTTELKPIILGCYFENNPGFQDNGLHGLLEVYSAEILCEGPITTSFTKKSQQLDSCQNTSESPNSAANSTVKKKKALVPEEALPDLIRLLHGNTKNRKVIAEEFQKFWSGQCSVSQQVKKVTDEPSCNAGTDGTTETVNDTQSDSSHISARQLHQTIREIATYCKPPESTLMKGCCWWVHDSVREKYGMLDAPIPNQWKYVSQKEPEPPKLNCASIKEFLSNNPEK